MNTSSTVKATDRPKPKKEITAKEARRLKRATRRMITKLSGADIELGNFILGGNEPHSTGYEASRALLEEVDGISDEMAKERGIADEDNPDGGGDDGREGYYSQDWNRKWLASNGGCVYIDLNHIELCIGEVLSAFDHAASWHAMLRIARRALRRANEKQPEGKRIVVLVNNSDGLGHSYGSHVNFAISRRAWTNIFSRRLHYLMYLASYHSSSIVFTGQGKVGSENGQPNVNYQIASRADFFEQVAGSQTTYYRPICNTRNEALTGSGRGSRNDIRRYHCIFFDNNLMYSSCVLKVGVTQMLLAAHLEMERVNPKLILEDPVAATWAFSHDPDLRTRVKTVEGKELTAVEHQLLILEELREPVEKGWLVGIVPHAAEIFKLYEDTLQKLHARDFDALRGRLDWVLKRHILEQAMTENSGLSWDSPQLKHLDHIYSSLDLDEGLFWAYDKAGIVERPIDERHIRRLTSEPPENTRAWTRAMLLRKAKPDDIHSIDWDKLTFRVPDQGYWPRKVKVDLSNPFASTKAQMQGLIHDSAGLKETLEVLERNANS